VEEVEMLGDHNAIATLGVKDIKRAKEFYEGALGLQLTPDHEPGTATYRSGTTVLFVYESRYAGTNEATAATWDVGGEIEAIVKALAAKGVTFEHYDDLPGTKREGDLHFAGSLKLAWFKDPDGNIHALTGR
jgi:catechol 2,3-dioxygenase-like lactoylglutathione lyase family enzyme